MSVKDEVELEVLGYYKLKNNLLDLKKGTVFCHIEHNDEANELGNFANGALLLCWEKGNCQCNWCGGAFSLPGQYSENKNFEKIENNGRYTPPTIYKKEDANFQLEMIKKKYKELGKQIDLLAIKKKQ